MEDSGTLLLWLPASEMLCSAGRQYRPRFPSWNDSKGGMSAADCCKTGRNFLSANETVDADNNLVAAALLRPVAAPELLVLLPDGLAPLHLLVLPRPQRLGHLCAKNNQTETAAAAAKSGRNLDKNEPPWARLLCSFLMNRWVCGQLRYGTNLAR
jgi:hypothetical protein